MSSDLFAATGSASASLPLASRMRPRNLDEYLGQEHLLAEGMPVRKAIEEGKLGSVILWAPPGCGKTTLAHIVAQYMDAVLVVKSAVTAGVADVREIAKAARDRLGFEGKATILLLDEIHHFNKSQQDALLGYLEDGTLTLVGATTENPFFVLNAALVSRARVIPLKPLEATNIRDLIQRALADEERGLGARGLTIAEDALEFLVNASEGDARRALNVLESASLLAPLKGSIELNLVEQVLQRKAVRYDRQGDNHFDTISAFIKSMRGSDSDGALHYLARMLSAGEDPRYIVRRMIVLASEDIGNAEPMALTMAVGALQAVERIGMPEARIILGQVVTFLCEAPKSNRAYLAIEHALKDVEDKPIQPIPMHLRNAPHSALKEFGHSEGYEYPHDFPSAFVNKSYLPEEADLSTPYYNPSDRGYEKKIVERRDQRSNKST